MLCSFHDRKTTTGGAYKISHSVHPGPPSKKNHTVFTLKKGHTVEIDISLYHSPQISLAFANLIIGYGIGYLVNIITNESKTVHRLDMQIYRTNRVHLPNGRKKNDSINYIQIYIVLHPHRHQLTVYFKSLSPVIICLIPTGPLCLCVFRVCIFPVW